MGRAPCCSKIGLHRGPWCTREDTLLLKYIQAHGEGNWRSLPKKAGLLRCGKSCRLRWVNYLRPDIKRGNITPDEEDLIIRLHSLLGNRWSLIAGRLPGRTDNEIKNYWNTHLSKRLISQGFDPNTHKPLVVQQDKNKRKTTTTNNSDRKSKSKLIVEVSEKPKIHLPKPIRFTGTTSFPLPRNDSFESDQCNTTSTALDKPWSGFVDCGNNDRGNMAGFLDDDDHDDFVNVSDFECRSKFLGSEGDSCLEKLYEEYLQVLETNHDADLVQVGSVDESLLIW
ncbi:hypothetical protein V6N11_073243 [Hibiscus sabdariffa]|uniref:Uncharacterized protein n=1 Tax=Hibiscus sabdariffa TaxID=183260 RepID=A0ABR2N6D4_9ROSI